MTHPELRKYLQTLLAADFAPAQPSWLEWHSPFTEPPEKERKGLGDRFFIGVLPARAAPVGSSPFCAVFYALQGTLTAELPDGPLPLREGQTLLLAPGVPLRITGSGENGIGISLILTQALLQEELHSVFVELGALRGVLLEHQPQQLLLDSRTSQPVRWYLEEMCCEHYAPDRCTWAALLPLLQMFLLSLNRCGISPATGRRRGDAETVADIVRYLHTDYADATLQSTAARFGFSANYLSHLLKEHTGRSFQEHRNEARIWHAAVLLARTDLPVADIAQEVGMQNLTHFYHLFQARYGLTPGAFRTRSREDGGSSDT